jgi:hypothetical protein
MHYHADELGTRGTRMVGGSPAAGEIYGFLHPGQDTAWLVMRNPSPEPQTAAWPLAGWLGWAPRTLRQVYPYWQDFPLLSGITLLGHEVRLLRLIREETADPSPIPGAPFMIRRRNGRYEYLFPGNKPLSPEIGPSVHPTMQIAEVTAEKTFDGDIEGGRRLQWFACIPYRFEKAELYVKLRGQQEALDEVTVRAGCSRYRGAVARHLFPALRIFRRERRGYGTSRWLPPVGERQRDDYAFSIPDGGWISLTLDILGKDAETLQIETWITGYESPARGVILRDRAPVDGPLLPAHPYGFARWLRL